MILRFFLQGISLCFRRRGLLRLLGIIVIYILSLLLLLLFLLEGMKVKLDAVGNIRKRSGITKLNTRALEGVGVVVVLREGWVTVIEVSKGIRLVCLQVDGKGFVFMGNVVACVMFVFVFIYIEKAH